MRDMNDLFVNDNCKTKVHCQGYVFTISELVNIAIWNLSSEELAAHEDIG